LTVQIAEEERQKLYEEFKKHVAEIQRQWKKHMIEHPYKAIIYCQATFDQDYQETLKCVERVSPHVDHTIIVEDGSLTAEQKQTLETYPNVKVKTVQFKDNLPEYRNAYLEEAKKIDPYGWVLVSDPDELMSESLCFELRDIVKALEEHGYNMAGINCHEAFECVEWLDDYDMLKESPAGYRKSTFFKNLLFKLSPNLRYEGIGHRTRNVHETWYAPDVPWRTVNLDTRFYYEHRKSALKIWRNAARNVFMGGGGDNLGNLIHEWRELRQICTELGINTWTEYEAYLKKGNIDLTLKNFLIKCLTLPATNWGTEYREMAKYHFAMHKEETTQEIMEKIKTLPPMPKESEVQAWVTKCYFDVLGRHPDEEGKRAYTEHILAGRLKPEDLPKILMQSQEFREKFGGKKLLKE
jgi:hypothetical protein